MVFLRKKVFEGKEYYYLVENYRKNGKVHQKNLKYVGSVVPKKEDLDNLYNTFTEKKIQQMIRKDLSFKPYKVSKDILDEAESLRKFFYDNLNKLSPQARKQLEKRFKTGFTYHSCSIEGNTLSRQQVDMVVNKKESVSGKKLIEIQEAVNHNRAIEYMYSENLDVTDDFIKRLHSVLMDEMTFYKSNSQGVDYDPDFVEGDYRKDQRFIEGADFIPVPPEIISEEMKTLIKFYKGNKYEIHPLELASEFHLRFAVIHPFSDGNGRMARLLMNFILDRSHFPMVDISVKNREKYLEALATGDGKNLTIFLLEELKTYTKEIFG